MREKVKKGIGVLLVAVLLAAAYWWGGNSPLLHGWDPSSKSRPSAVVSQTAAPKETELTEAEDTPNKTEEPQESKAPGLSYQQQEREQKTPPPSVSMTAEEKMAAAARLAEEQGKSFPLEDSGSGNPPPKDVGEQSVEDRVCRCVLSVSCKSILRHPDWLSAEKWSVIPADGEIFPPTEVTFQEGENAFTVLSRELRRAGIPMEFTTDPVLGSVYIEGISNLYEYDCGDLSGWMYAVNDWFPGYGCSQYVLREGDVLSFQYSCEMGADL